MQGTSPVDPRVWSGYRRRARMVYTVTKKCYKKCYKNECVPQKKVLQKTILQRPNQDLPPAGTRTSLLTRHPAACASLHHISARNEWRWIDNGPTGQSTSCALPCPRSSEQGISPSPIWRFIHACCTGGSSPGLHCNAYLKDSSG